jgi:tetratricopeptide (TPR) repeat protein
LGIDVDGPQNDKGLYGLIPIRRVSTISNDYVIRWSAFTENGSPKRFGFMSQVSPDGKYVITSIGVPGTHGTRVVDRLYNGFYDNYGFGQVFFPTRGVLAWYSRETGKLLTLPGADDPDYVQTSAFWSPDGKYLVYSRAKAKDPYAPGQKRATYANDPNETQIQYDLYRIPFNNGKGGTPERIVGASDDGASNNFPKVSPDGKWIVFVRNKNGLLMRPDSQLYIVPFAGGFARLLSCNQPVMNSWHSFSPNGRWLVFSSKSPSLYTRMYLTHIDSNGKDSPAIAVENATAANRAVNIPEFMNVAARSLERIDAPATEFYRQFDVAVQFAEKKKFADAVPAWKKAIEMDPVDPRAHNNLAVALMETGQTRDAIAEYRKSLQLNPDSAQTQNNLGSALAESGSLEEAVSHFGRALALDPDNAAAHINLGNALAAEGGHTQEAIGRWKGLNCNRTRRTVRTGSASHWHEPEIWTKPWFIWRGQLAWRRSLSATASTLAGFTPRRKSSARHSASLRVPLGYPRCWIHRFSRCWQRCTPRPGDIATQSRQHDVLSASRMTRKTTNWQPH